MAFDREWFAADTAFERFAVERLGTHRVRPANPGATFDIRGATRNISVVVGTATSGAGAREELRLSLTPLSFGATYKVLDQLVEHVLRVNGVTGRLTFKEKLKQAAPVVLPVPLDTRRDVWDRLFALYRGYADARHAVTHRRATVAADGGVTVHDDDGVATDTVSADEVAAFAAAVHAVAEMVIDGTADTRRMGIAEWYLDCLHERHGLPIFGARDVTAGTRLLIVDLRDEDGFLVLEMAAPRETVAGQEVPTAWDVQMHDTHNRVFVARWEDLPACGETFRFRPEALPEWVAEQIE